MVVVKILLWVAIELSSLPQRMLISNDDLKDSTIFCVYISDSA